MPGGDHDVETVVRPKASATAAPSVISSQISWCSDRIQLAVSVGVLVAGVPAAGRLDFLATTGSGLPAASGGRATLASPANPRACLARFSSRMNTSAASLSPFFSTIVPNMPRIVISPDDIRKYAENRMIETPASAIHAGIQYARPSPNVATRMPTAAPPVRMPSATTPMCRFRLHRQYSTPLQRQSLHVSGFGLRDMVGIQPQRPELCNRPPLHEPGHSTRTSCLFHDITIFNGCPFIEGLGGVFHGGERCDPGIIGGQREV